MTILHHLKYISSPILSLISFMWLMKIYGKVYFGTLKARLEMIVETGEWK